MGRPHRALLPLPALLASLLGAPAAAEYPLEIIRLQGRPSAEMVPLIEPFVGPDGAVVASGDKLILRTSPERLQQIRGLLKQLDRPPRRLMVHVRRGRLHESDLAYAAAGVDLGDERWRLQAGAPVAPDSAALSLGQVSRRGDLEVDQRVQAVEGHPAFIRAGRMQPSGSHYPEYGYRASGGGFYVVPRLAGERVILEISTRAVRPAGPGGVVALHGLDTQVQGRLGQWISLGGVAVSGSGRAQGLLQDAAGSARESDEIHILVEEIP
jgi:hypothetical protein